MLETRRDRNKPALLVSRDWQRHHPHCPPLPGGGAPPEASAAPLVGPGALSATSFLPFDLSVFNVSLLLFRHPTCSPQESLAPSQVRPIRQVGCLRRSKQMKTWDPVSDHVRLPVAGAAALLASGRRGRGSLWSGDCCHSVLVALLRLAPRCHGPIYGWEPEAWESLPVSLGYAHHWGRVPPTSRLRSPPGFRLLHLLLRTPGALGAWREHLAPGSQTGPERASTQLGPLLSLPMFLMATTPGIPVGGHMAHAGESQHPLLRRGDQGHRGSGHGATFLPGLSGSQPPGRPLSRASAPAGTIDLARRGQVSVRFFRIVVKYRKRKIDRFNHF